MSERAEDASTVPVPEAPPVPVEPLLGFTGFVSLRQLSPAHEAALRTWMRLHHRDPQRHYATATWQEAYQAMLADH